MKKVLVVCSLILLVAACSSASKTDSGDAMPGMDHGAMKGMENAPQAAAPTEPETGVVDAGNKTCPISGEPVNGQDFVTYQGKRYGLCCSDCAKEFLKDPQKYIQKLKDKGELWASDKLIFIFTSVRLLSPALTANVHGLSS